MEKKRLLPPTYFLICILLAIVMHFTLPFFRLIHPPYNYVGALFIGVGIWFNFWPDRLFKRKNTTVNPFEKPTFFIQEGPFCFTRHPMYLGMVIVLIGEAVLLGSISPFICPLGFFIAMHLIFIPKEEEALEKAFGQHFISYKKRVRRWL